MIREHSPASAPLTATWGKGKRRSVGRASRLCRRCRGAGVCDANDDCGAVTRPDAPADGGDAPGGRDSGARESAILAAALRLFLERGYRDTTISRIASACRLTPAEVHRRFGSKSDVLGLLIDREIEAARAPYARGLPHFESALDAARFIANHHRTAVESSPLPALTRIAIEAREHDPTLVGLFETSDGREQGHAYGEHVLETLIERGLFRRCDVPTAVRQMQGMLNQALYIEPRALGRPLSDLDEYIEACVQAFCTLYAADA